MITSPNFGWETRGYRYVQKWHLRKTSDISETKKPRAKLTECIETRVRLKIYRLPWLQIWWHSVNFGLLFREHNFLTVDISHSRILLVGAPQNLAALGDWPIETYSPNFVNFGSRVPWCGDMHQSFTDALVKWFFDNLPIFADSFSVVSIHCVTRSRIRCKHAPHETRDQARPLHSIVHVFKTAAPTSIISETLQYHVVLSIGLLSVDSNFINMGDRL